MYKNDTFIRGWRTESERDPLEVKKLSIAKDCSVHEYSPGGRGIKGISDR